MADLLLKVKVAVEGANKLRNLGDDLASTGKGLTVGVTVPLLAAGAGFAKMAAEAKKGEAVLESVFDSMGAASWTTVDALNAQAEALAQATAFDDDAIREAQATLLTFGNVVGESFDRGTEAALDMAEFFGTDLQTASVQLGKALNDPIAGLASLGRIGVQFTEDQKALIQSFVDAGDMASAQNIILQELEKQIGGVAEAVAATDAGKWQQTMNALGEAAEAAGVFILPFVTGLANGLKAIADGFSNLPGPAQGVVVALAGLVAAVGPAIWIGGKLIENFKAIGAAFNALKLLLLTNPFIALAAAVVALVALIVLNWDKIVEVFEGALDFIADTGKKLWTPVSKGFTAAIDVIRGAWNAFARWWNSIQINVPGFDVPFVGRVGGFSIGLPDLPMLAEGGIVTQPTLALIGERGPEAVVPLDRMGQQTTELHIHLENHGPPITEEDDVIDTLQQIAPLLDGRLAYAG